MATLSASSRSIRQPVGDRGDRPQPAPALQRPGRSAAILGSVLDAPWGGPVKPECARCRDCGRVCENHPDTPWQGAHAIECGAGMPCPDCNQPDEDELPRLPFTLLTHRYDAFWLSGHRRTSCGYPRIRRQVRDGISVQFFSTSAARSAPRRQRPAALELGPVL